MSQPSLAAAMQQIALAEVGEFVSASASARPPVELQPCARFNPALEKAGSAA